MAIELVGQRAEEAKKIMDEVCASAMQVGPIRSIPRGVEFVPPTACSAIVHVHEDVYVDAGRIVSVEALNQLSGAHVKVVWQEHEKQCAASVWSMPSIEAAQDLARTIVNSVNACRFPYTIQKQHAPEIGDVGGGENYSSVRLGTVTRGGTVYTGQAARDVLAAEKRFLDAAGERANTKMMIELTRRADAERTGEAARKKMTREEFVAYVRNTIGPNDLEIAECNCGEANCPGWATAKAAKVIDEKFPPIGRNDPYIDTPPVNKNPHKQCRIYRFRDGAQIPPFPGRKFGVQPAGGGWCALMVTDLSFAIIPEGGLIPTFVVNAAGDGWVEEKRTLFSGDNPIIGNAYVKPERSRGETKPSTSAPGGFKPFGFQELMVEAAMRTRSEAKPKDHFERGTVRELTAAEQQMVDDVEAVAVRAETAPDAVHDCTCSTAEICAGGCRCGGK